MIKKWVVVKCNLINIKVGGVGYNLKNKNKKTIDVEMLYSIWIQEGI